MVRLGAVGDLIRTMPALHLLRECWPGTRIAWVVEEHLAPLLAEHPQLDRVFTIDRHGFLEEARRWSPRALGRVLHLRRELRAFRPELAIDFQGCLKSGLASAFSGARVRLGFEREHVRERSHLFANLRVPLDSLSRHRVRRALSLARAAGADDGEPRRIPTVDLAFSAEERQHGRELRLRFAGHGRTVAIAPFTSRRQHWKRYPVLRWRTIASGLAARGFPVVLVAGPGEESEAREIARACSSGVGVCEGLALRELGAMLADCELFIGGDTGPMHMAWAVGTRVMAVFGPTLPELNSPVGEGHDWLAPERRTDRDAEDKFPGVSPERVLELALRALQEAEPAGGRQRIAQCAARPAAAPATANGHRRAAALEAMRVPANGRSQEPATELLPEPARALPGLGDPRAG